MEGKPVLIVKAASVVGALPEVLERRGDVQDWIIRTAGLDNDSVEVVSVFEGESLPEPEALQAVIISGSPAMITEGLDWTERTAAWVNKAMAAGIPIFGICFGHQLIAHALGGLVGKNPQGPEYGTVTVKRKKTAGEDPVFKYLPTVMTVQVAHYESVLILPEGAVSLAENRMDANHVVRYNQRTWGVQFHPEMDAETVKSILSLRREDLSGAGVQVADELRSCRDSEHGALVLERFLRTARE
ncbi:MAG: glutamine amidotransferase [Proteobacteria bacterium]|nr:glutamine amidotransferase [Pseudomonadota bacterium]